MTRLLFALLLTLLMAAETSAIAPKNEDSELANLKNVLAQNADSASAQKLVEEGERLSQQQTIAARLQAIAKWEEARSLWQREGNLEQEAATLIKLGEMYRDLDATTPARERYSEALALVRQLGNRLQEALILGQLGRINQRDADRWKEEHRIYSDLSSIHPRRSDVFRKKSYSDRDKATKFYQQVLEIYQDLNQSPEPATLASRQSEARLLNQLGEVENDSWKKYKLFEQALEIYKEIGDKKGEALVLSKLSELYFYEQLNYQAGLESFNQARTIYQNISASSEEDANWAKKQEARLLNKLVRYWWSENRATALEFHKQALRLSEEIGDRYGKAFILENLGALYVESSNFQKGLTVFQQALAIYEDVGDVVKQRKILGNLGDIYYLLGK